MNEKITQQQIKDCIYLFKNAAMRNPEHTKILVNVHAAHCKCDRTYDDVVNAMSEDVDAFNNLVENLKQTIKQSIYLDNQRL